MECLSFQRMLGKWTGSDSVMLAQVSSVSHCHCMVSYVVHGLRLEGFAFAVSLFALEIYVYFLIIWEIIIICLI